MPSASRSAIIQAPVEALWRRLAEIESWPRWLRVPYASESLTVTSGGPVAEGTEFTMKGRLKSRLFARITAWKENRWLAFEICRSDYPSDRLTFGRAIITIELEPLEEGRTRVTCHHRLDGRGVLGRLYAVVVMRALMSTNTQRILDSLAAVE